MTEGKSLPEATITHVTALVAPRVELSRVRQSPRVKAFQRDLFDFIGKHGGLAMDKKLAIAAHVTGTVLSYIEVGKVPPLRADEIIRRNIATGVQAGLAEQARAKKGKK